MMDSNNQETNLHQLLFLNYLFPACLYLVFSAQKCIKIFIIGIYWTNIKSLYIYIYIYIYIYTHIYTYTCKKAFVFSAHLNFLSFFFFPLVMPFWDFPEFFLDNELRDTC